MKNTNKKGFTLVELVIVIAVIAILAGVLIGTFASVINRANESARLQEVKAQEIEQKAEDILKKIDDSNWYGWEDFEVSLASKLEESYKKYASLNDGPTTDQIKTVVKEALEEYGKNTAQSNTSLTEEQVKVIIENALSKASLGGVTEAQVRAIIDSATSQIQGTQLTPAQVKSIVNAATAKNLTAADVAKVVADAQLATASDLNTAVETLKLNLEAIQNGALSVEDVENIIKKYLPITGTVETVDEFNEAVETWNSGSTIVVSDSLKATALTLATNDVKELNVKGLDDTSNIQVNAPYATINFLTNVGTITVKASAMKSVHLHGTVTTLVVEKGRVVLEEGAQVGTLNISASSDVVVDIEKTAKVTDTLTVEKTDGNVEVNNKGVVDKVAAGDTDAGRAVFNNIDDGKITNNASAETANGVTDDHIIIFDKEGKNDDVTVVMNLDELLEALANEEKYIKFGANISTISSEDKLINIKYSTILDGNGFTLDGPGGLRGTVNQLICIGYNVEQENRIKSVTIKNLNITSSTATRPLECRGKIDAITLENVKVDITSVSKKVQYHQPFTYGGTETQTMKFTARNCKFLARQDASSYALIIWNPIDMYLENTDIEGWASLYFKPDAKYSNVELNGCTLKSVNHQNGLSNDFGAIVFEDGHAKVVLVNTFIDASEVGNAEQYAILFSTYWANYYGTDLTDVAVYVKEGTIIKGRIVLGSDTDSSNMAYIEGGTFEMDPSEWVAEGLTVTKEGDYYVVGK